MKMGSDINDAIAVTRDSYWIGFFEDTSKLHCNPYLLLDDEEAVFFDPGSIPDFPVIMRKVIDLTNPNMISTIVASHQDPDVSGNLAVVEDVIAREDLKIVAHLNTCRLIQHQDLKSELFRVTDDTASLELASGRKLEFIPVPFLHSPGAIVTYDPKTKTLFSGDLFGGLIADWDLFAEGENLEGIKVFHQTYMPCNAILRPAMERFEAMEIHRILPQHGSVLEGDRVKEAIAFLKDLPCGNDLTKA